MSDLLFDLRIKNNNLIKNRMRLGLTQEQVGKKIGIGGCSYGCYENLRCYPYQNGKWSKLSLRLSELFEVPVEKLFPELLKEIKKTRILKEVPLCDVLEYRDYNKLLIEERHNDNKLELIEFKNGMHNVVTKTLSKREHLVLKLRFGLDGEDEKTLDEVGLIIGTSRERVRQIEAKALRKLRHPSRTKILRNLIPTEWNQHER